VRKSRVGEPVLEGAIIGEQKQAFAVAVEPSHRIHVLHRNVLPQGLFWAGELAQDAIWLVEDKIVHISDYARAGSRAGPEFLFQLKNEPVKG
jgi:hypothetical protein